MAQIQGNSSTDGGRLDGSIQKRKCTTTALSWTSGVLPVDTKVYVFNWLVVA